MMNHYDIRLLCSSGFGINVNAIWELIQWLSDHLPAPPMNYQQDKSAM